MLLRESYLKSSQLIASLNFDVYAVIVNELQGVHKKFVHHKIINKSIR
jgi:hypothetical protein